MDARSLQDLRKAVEQELNWPASNTWSAAHFDELSERITTSTNVRLSATTLKRVWGRVNYNGQPSRTTLDTLARFTGHASWVTFVANHQPTLGEAAPSEPTTTKDDAPRPRRKRRWITGALLLTGLFVAAAILRPYPTAGPTVERFTFDPVTTGLPNTVQFRYALSGAYDSVEIQQSWDERLRYRVAPDNGFHASTYYYPGVYQAKLVVDGAVAEERTLVVPSAGWLGTRGTDKGSLPVYFSINTLQTATGLAMQAADPDSIAELHYITEAGFGAGSDATLTTRFRPLAGDVCGFSDLLLFYQNGVIILPFAAPGCTGELEALALDQRWSGRDHDLSGFGVAPDQWINLTVRQRADSIRVWRADRPIFGIELPQPTGRLLGLRYRFPDGGEVEKATVNDQNLLK